jgi:hypothetical protein
MSKRVDKLSQKNKELIKYRPKLYLSCSIKDWWDNDICPSHMMILVNQHLDELVRLDFCETMEDFIEQVQTIIKMKNSKELYALDYDLVKKKIVKRPELAIRLSLQNKEAQKKGKGVFYPFYDKPWWDDRICPTFLLEMIELKLEYYLSVQLCKSQEDFLDQVELIVRAYKCNTLHHLNYDGAKLKLNDESMEGIDAESKTNSMEVESKTNSMEVESKTKNSTFMNVHDKEEKEVRSSEPVVSVKTKLTWKQKLVRVLLRPCVSTHS